MKRVLVLASVASMIDQFNMPNIKILQELGYEVDVACNFVLGSTCSDEKIEKLKTELCSMGVRCFQIDFARNITNIRDNLKALWQVKSILKKYKYSFLHCHSPIGGLIGRIAGNSTKTKVIYTAHGFHFYKGAPLKNWIMYYPVEKLCSRMTDVLITINKEDYSFAKKHMKANKIVYVPGVGINLKNNVSVDAKEKRKELDIPENAILCINVGELIKRKNQELIIKTIAQIENDDLFLIIAGKGPLENHLKELIADNNLSNKVKLLGFRTDIRELNEISDIFIFSSLHEGLPVAVMEAMAHGLPVVCSNIRGNVDLIDDKGGILFNPKSIVECKNGLEHVINSNKKMMGERNKRKIQNFSLDTVEKITKKIYIDLDKRS